MEGPDAAFAAGRLAGIIALDGIRATQNFEGSLPNINAKPLVVGLGYSGGGIGTGWAASLQPTYAPELNMKGWVIGGTVPDLAAAIKYVAGTWANGFLPIAFNGFGKATAYGTRFKTFLDSVLTPDGRDALAWADERCTAESIVEYAYQSVLDTSFQTLGADVLEHPRFREVTDDNLMGSSKNETPTVPVLLYHGKADELAPFDPVSKLNDEWCGNGATVQFSVYESGGHFITPVLALLETIKYTATAMSSKVSTGCTQTSSFDIGVSSWNFDPILLPLATIAQGLIDLFGLGDEKIAKNPRILL